MPQQTPPPYSSSFQKAPSTLFYSSLSLATVCIRIVQCVECTYVHTFKHTHTQERDRRRLVPPPLLLFVAVPPPTKPPNASPQMCIPTICWLGPTAVCMRGTRSSSSSSLSFAFFLFLGSVLQSVVLLQRCRWDHTALAISVMCLSAPIFFTLLHLKIENCCTG